MDQKLYAKNASFVPKLTQKLMALANLQPHESVLDFGCGDGVLTKHIQASQNARVVGIDNQTDMIEAAKQAGITDARLVSAQQLKDEADLQQADFDVVFTNAVLHWIPDLQNKEDPFILRSVLKALKPSGRFVGEFGAFTNCQEIIATLCLSMLHHGVPLQRVQNISPFFYPTDEAWQALLENAGFTVKHIESEARVTLLPGKVSDWARTFLERFLAHTGDKREAVLADLDTVMELTNKDEQGRYYAGYRRLRFIATPS